MQRTSTKYFVCCCLEASIYISFEILSAMCLCTYLAVINILTRLKICEALFKKQFEAFLARTVCATGSCLYMAKFSKVFCQLCQGNKTSKKPFTQAQHS